MTTGSDEPCPACRAGFENECWFAWDTDKVSCGEVQFDAAGNVKLSTNENLFTDNENEGIDGGYLGDAHTGSKSLGDYRDAISTGRKFAAQAAPINAGQVCEWAGLARAGGGVVPIVGCIGRPASDRHHGPDKNTMNNAVGTNLHRICDHCHNTWHALNDPHYGERPEHTKPFLPLSGECLAHDPNTRATMEQIIAAESKRLA